MKELSQITPQEATIEACGGDPETMRITSGVHICPGEDFNHIDNYRITGVDPIRVVVFYLCDSCGGTGKRFFNGFNVFVPNSPF